MDPQKLSLDAMLSLIELDASRGIVDKRKILETVQERGVFPGQIRDIRQQLRMAIEREGDYFLVTQFPTELASESINEIY